eukprot:1149325-Pelagomonas_calceolata.AAC.5
MGGAHYGDSLWQHEPAAPVDIEQKRATHCQGPEFLWWCGLRKKCMDSLQQNESAAPVDKEQNHGTHTRLVVSVLVWAKGKVHEGALALKLSGLLGAIRANFSGRVKALGHRCADFTQHILLASHSHARLQQCKRRGRHQKNANNRCLF